MEHKFHKNTKKNIGWKMEHFYKILDKFNQSKVRTENCFVYLYNINVRKYKTYAHKYTIDVLFEQFDICDNAVTFYHYHFTTRLTYTMYILHTCSYSYTNMYSWAKVETLNKRPYYSYAAIMYPRPCICFCSKTSTSESIDFTYMTSNLFLWWHALWRPTFLFVFYLTNHIDYISFRQTKDSDTRWNSTRHDNTNAISKYCGKLFRLFYNSIHILITISTFNAANKLDVSFLFDLWDHAVSFPFYSIYQVV